MASSTLRRHFSTLTGTDIRETFRVMDADADGYVRAEDLKRLFAEAGLELSERDTLILLKATRGGACMGRKDVRDVCRGNVRCFEELFGRFNKFTQCFSAFKEVLGMCSSSSR